MSKTNNKIKKYIDLPETLDILGQKYLVITKKLEQNYQGFCMQDHCVIEISEDIHNDARWEILIHEALHALLGVTGLSNDLGESIEENVVRRLAPALLHFMRNNSLPGVSKCLSNQK